MQQQQCKSKNLWCVLANNMHVSWQVFLLFLLASISSCCFIVKYCLLYMLLLAVIVCIAIICLHLLLYNNGQVLIYSALLISASIVCLNNGKILSTNTPLLCPLSLFLSLLVLFCTIHGKHEWSFGHSKVYFEVRHMWVYFHLYWNVDQLIEEGLNAGTSSGVAASTGIELNVGF